MPYYRTPAKAQDWGKLRGGVNPPTSTRRQATTSAGPMTLEPSQAPKTPANFWPRPTSATDEAIEAGTLVFQIVDGLTMRFRPNGRVYPVLGYETSDGRFFLVCSKNDGGNGDFFKYEGVKTLRDFEKSRFFVARRRNWSTLR